jgi:glycosyl hydrolase family 20
MPIALQPTPRRLRRTHENFMLGHQATLAVSPGAEPEIVQALLGELEELFPDLERETGDQQESATVRFSLFAEGEDAPEEVPADVAGEAFRLRVSPEGVVIAAGSETGWLMAVKMLPGLREGDELAGVALLDWPSFPERQIDLPWPAGTVSETSLGFCVSLLAKGRINRLGLHRNGSAGEIPAAVREELQRSGIRVVEPARQPSFRLLEYATLFPAYSRLLAEMREAAVQAEAEQGRVFVIDLGEMDAQTSLEALAYGVLFAGDCAWNPQKADPKLFRRWYSSRRLGFDSRAPVHVVDELEAAAAQLDGGDASRGIALESGDPFDGQLLAGMLQPEERAAAVGRGAAAALAAMAPLQPDSEERAHALQGLQWTAQRLKLLSRRLGAAARARELYRAAYVATASPKAVSDRLLKAAALLESEARALDEHRAEWHALWRRERQGPMDPATEAGMRAHVEALRARAERMRALRDRYIQTGSLPAAAEEGLALAGTHLSTGLAPARLPPQPSPAWWPEGGAARLRLEVECPEPAAGMVWAVRIDFRALAGESGAFNVRSVRLLPLTEADEAGPERPCQLLRGGVAFLTEPGSRSYFLYLDPEPGPDSPFRETRASQSRLEARLENRRMRLSLASGTACVTAWQLREPELELLPEETADGRRQTADRQSQWLPDGIGPVELPSAVSRLPSAVSPREWRLRVVETGPLLARVRAEHSDGQVRQFDLGAGHSWAEISVNSAWNEFILPLRSELWSDRSMIWIGRDGGIERRPFDGTAREFTEVRWAALYRSDGLTAALALPEVAADGLVEARGLRLRGRPHGGCVLLFAGLVEDPAVELTRLLAAFQGPPQVRLGVIEERRVREF